MRRPTWFNVVAVALGLAFLYLPIAILVIYSFNASQLVTVWVDGRCAGIAACSPIRPSSTPP
jgi:ABC-type spermidine/putrescine transport system permease subunit II